MNAKIVDNPFPKRGESNAEAVALDELAAPLKSLTEEVSALIKKYKLESAEIKLDGMTSGDIKINNSIKSGVTIQVNGSLCGNDIPSGTPYYAHYNGEFFWKPAPDSEDFVKSGALVKKGQLVGWAMGESKDMSFGIRADQDGIINMAIPNASKVREDETLLYYIEER